LKSHFSSHFKTGTQKVFFYCDDKRFRIPTLIYDPTCDYRTRRQRSHKALDHIYSISSHIYIGVVKSVHSFCELKGKDLLVAFAPYAFLNKWAFMRERKKVQRLYSWLMILFQIYKRHKIFKSSLSCHTIIILLTKINFPSSGSCHPQSKSKQYCPCQKLKNYTHYLNEQITRFTVNIVG